MKVANAPILRATSSDSVAWLSDATFSADPAPPAVNSRVVTYWFGDSPQFGKVLATFADLYAASYTSQINVLESVVTPTYDSWAMRFWDDGLPVNNFISWEGDDAGAKGASARLSAGVDVGVIRWIPAESAAELLNVSVTELTPTKFNAEYAKVWSQGSRGF